MHIIVLSAFRSLTLLITVLLLVHSAYAGCELDTDEFRDLTGYEIKAVKKVAGWVDERAGRVGNAKEWEGCRYDRKIIFEDGTSFICRSYQSSSAWGVQTAIIFAKYSDHKVCIDNTLLEVKNG